MEDPGARFAQNGSRREFLRSAGLLVLVGGGLAGLAACGDTDVPDAAPRGIAVSLYRQTGCSCCATYADYLRQNGFTVDLKTVDDLGPVRRKHAIPDDGVGCHTSLMDDYVVEGHVPVEAIDRLLSERPAVDGITVVGMPVSAPGMGKPNGTPLEVLSFHDGQVAEYMSVTTF